MRVYRYSSGSAALYAFGDGVHDNCLVFRYALEAMVNAGGICTSIGFQSPMMNSFTIPLVGDLSRES